MTDENTKEFASEEVPSSKKGFNILILDDDRFLLDMYSLKFTQEGNTIQACLSVDEVLTALRNGFAADAIVFDLVLPNKDGFELLRALKEEKLGEKAVLIALTNQGEDEERKKTEEMGADGYIVKASTVPSEVVTTIVGMIKEHHAA
jgi:DNA-binding response OmpR family regulator